MNGGHRFRFGLRALIAAVTLAALLCGGIAWQNRRVQERTALIAELSQANVQVVMEEPTGFGQLALKFIPQREPWLREQLGPGWFARPTALVGWKLDDNAAAYAVPRLKRLGTVREVYIQGDRLTEQGAAAMRGELPGINVTDWDDPAQHHYSRSVTYQAHFALEGVAILALFTTLMLGTLGFIAWWLLRSIAWREPRGRVRTSATG